MQLRRFGQRRKQRRQEGVRSLVRQQDLAEVGVARPRPPYAIDPGADDSLLAGHGKGANIVEAKRAATMLHLVELHPLENSILACVEQERAPLRRAAHRRSPNRHLRIGIFQHGKRQPTRRPLPLISALAQLARAWQVLCAVCRALELTNRPAQQVVFVDDGVKRTVQLTGVAIIKPQHNRPITGRPHDVDHLLVPRPLDNHR